MPVKDVIVAKGKVLRSGKYEIRIYIYGDYKEPLEQYVGREVDVIVIVRE